ncbi:hypothetical protein [Candidatus Parabeggiatoa sp. HSG14]|uniref:hypothetical protein n=1 Tax=Candidatus Parabeggiatoa sp. HSG14 TaxID=3055593 RepID=UPI0025A894A5|nr:hypothetical protein [Thiotrichales bacterium HSG14]
MKFFLTTILGLCLSNSVFAIEIQIQNTFIMSQNQVNAFAISEPVGIMIPTTYPNMVSTTQIIPNNLHTGHLLFNVKNQGNTSVNLMTSSRKNDPTAPLLGTMGAMSHESTRASANHINYMAFSQKTATPKQIYQNEPAKFITETKGNSIFLADYQSRLDIAQDSLKIVQNVQSNKSNFSVSKGTAGKVVKIQNEEQNIAETVYVHIKQAQEKQNTFITSTDSSLSLLHKESFYAGIAGATWGGGYEIFSQLSTGKAFDWQRFSSMTLLNGASGYSGTFTGAVVHRTLINNQSRLFSKLLSTKFSASIVGGFSAGVMASAVFSYGTYFLGYTDLKTANRSMIAGTLGAGVFSVGSTMVKLLLSESLTAGIISLGTAASGVGLVAIVAIGVGTGTMYLFQLGDNKVERKRVNHLITSIQKDLMKPL